MVSTENTGKKKIILVNASRIMRDMLIRAIESKSDLEIDREILVKEDLNAATMGGIPLDADWLIAVETGRIIPLPVMDAADSNPRTRLVILATDGSQVMLRWFEEKTRVVDRLDLPELIEILKGDF